jgi:hypothetical protein
MLKIRLIPISRPLVPDLRTRTCSDSGRGAARVSQTIV